MRESETLGQLHRVQVLATTRAKEWLGMLPRLFTGAHLYHTIRPSAGGDGGGGSFSGHALRGYAALSMGELEGAPLLAAMGHVVSLGEMLMQVQLNYKKYEQPAGRVSRTCTQPTLS
jgi:hypothetical protein